MRWLLRVLILVVVIGAALGVGWWWHIRHAATSTELVLYGNVDLRQIQLAFNNSERIAEVKFDEGATVKKGDVLARLDTRRLEPQVAQVEAQTAAQRQVYERLFNGSRPEEIAQAEAHVHSAKVDAANARRQYQRLKGLASVRLSDKSEVRGASQEDIDNAKAAWDVSEAKLVVQQKALDLANAGPRTEEVEEAKARLESSEGQLAFLRQQLADAELRAPEDAIVRTRLMEPGEISSPQRPVFSLAVIKRKWVRAYVSETDLGKVTEGMSASIAVDSFPGRRFKGEVGSISPVAEFTPKTVQTEELRTSLVYEVRVLVDDPDNKLRLGMPATVYLTLGD